MYVPRFKFFAFIHRSPFGFGGREEAVGNGEGPPLTKLGKECV